jgi:hypothetical protein
VVHNKLRLLRNHPMLGNMLQLSSFQRNSLSG